MNWRSVISATLIPSLLLGGLAWSQEEEPQQAAEPKDPEAIEEIVVRASRDGDPKSLELKQAEMLKAQVFAMYRQVKRDEEEQAWRSTLPKAYGNFGRIKWGYDADAELRMRRESGLDDVEPGAVRPATIIRVEFE